MNDNTELLVDLFENFDVKLLDDTVHTFYNGSGVQQKRAQRALTQFEENPESWQYADRILQYSSSSFSKFIGLSVLDRMINTKWKLLPVDQRLGVRNFVVGLILSYCQDDIIFKNEKNLINKANLTLVCILKQEWPQNWQEFIPELIASSPASLNICENNLSILKLLSEEVFEYSSGKLTQAKAKFLKDSMTNEFEQIFAFCIQMLQQASSPSLIVMTLETILRYLAWIPATYIFDTNLIDSLENYLSIPETRKLALKCLTEISSLEISQTNDILSKKLALLFELTIQKISESFMSLSTDLKEIYSRASSRDQYFLEDFAIFLTTFLTRHRSHLENHEVFRQALIISHEYLIQLSRIDEKELYKIALEYWHDLVSHLFLEIQQYPVCDENPSLELSFMSMGTGAVNPQFLKRFPLKKHIYEKICSELRVIVVEKMVRPDEVLVVENEEGEFVKETYRESDTIQLYQTAREVLVYLTHLNVNDTQNLIQQKLKLFENKNQCDVNQINPICWAIGSISGTMREETEQYFLLSVLEELMTLSENQGSKENKDVFASNMIYIVGQYPRFLKNRWDFMTSVISKLFEFMRIENEGIQDMACDTFMKIAKRCKYQLVTKQQNEENPLIKGILEQLPTTTSELTPDQAQLLYEACGLIVAEERNEDRRSNLLQDLMQLPNQVWDRTIEQVKAAPTIMCDPVTLKITANIIRTNNAVCTGMKEAFSKQISSIYPDLLNLYKVVSTLINDQIGLMGTISIKTPQVRGFRIIKKEILKLSGTYITGARNLEELTIGLIDPLLNIVLEDYRTNIPEAKDAEVLNCLTTIILKVGHRIPHDILLILQSTFECTLAMINKDFIEFPEHRIQFYKLLRAINDRSFVSFLDLPQDAFKLFFDSICWAFNHNNRDIESNGLQIATDLLRNVTMLQRDSPFALSFYNRYYLAFVSKIFEVMTDPDHKSGFSQQALLLMRLFAMVEENKIPLAIYDERDAPSGTSNRDYLAQYLSNLLCSAFPNITRIQVESFLKALSRQYKNLETFSETLRDFLVQIKEAGGDPTDYLFAEEREEEIKRQKMLKYQVASKVAGLLKPSDMEND
ncbi:hypothetical protein KAFR_0E02060 [Kazachstania africana CBS 2517]|uniref:Exportin-1 n=1 Tax=Kazachstania africana (strain ATCC 22294 / BCRC 22015 / CBS 2517 / CECT 1963 / NBRC 1671 / NRRL Y-8276) TaxID=1071382 RepID=H2AVF9_KAZAF|nr:hypothetical protein KAFR_0E02060 [Kazachstania africana CBS 2517]CCF58359.1 hypothetical protein KAFR_0E02060 [Kazachstania africana CBS 2517]